MLYLSPLLFAELGFSSSEIGWGITIAAISGSISRILSGFCLDKGISFNILLKAAAIIAIFADLFLFNSLTYKTYLEGQFLLGASAGIYWPASELAVPITCGNYPSSKGFALVRSADALGISIGSFLGTIASWISFTRFIFLIDIFCLMVLIYLLTNKILKEGYIQTNLDINNEEDFLFTNNKSKTTIKALLPILTISIFATSIFSLLQSGLPLDLINGSTYRGPIGETFSGLILSLQLGLILLFQWPIGNWLSTKNIDFGLKLSLLSLSIGCLLIALSSRLTNGILLIIFALFFIALGLTAFLPTATEGIIQTSTISKRGMAMALFSQCFGLSSIFAPIASGKIIDIVGDGMFIWLSIGIISMMLIPLTSKVKENLIN